MRGAPQMLILLLALAPTGKVALALNLRSPELGRTAVPPFARRPPAMSLSERLAVSPPADEIVRAVEATLRARPADSRFTASEIAADCGVSLPTAQRGLNELATALAGDQGVSVAASERGELLYSFPRDVRQALAARSQAAQLRDSWNPAKPALAKAGRIAFGISLFVSIAIVFATIVVAASATGSSSDDERRDDRRSSRASDSFGDVRVYNNFGGRYNPFYDPFYSPFDIWLRPRPYYASYWGSPPKMSLLEGIFSFVFGDGDPNLHLKAARIRAMASVIRQNGGAVIAEQLAPYLDPPEEPADALSATNVDESWVLPACLELGGRPEVSEDGTIVYVFDDMAVSAAVDAADLALADARLDEIESLSDDELHAIARERGVPATGARSLRSALRSWAASLTTGNAGQRKGRSVAQSVAPAGYIEERAVRFSEAEGGQQLAAAALAGLNLAGVGYLGSLFSSLPAGVLLPGWVSLVAAAYPALVVYAFSYLAIPATRAVLNSQTNAAIDRRNAARRKWRDLLKGGSAAVKRRLNAARAKRVRGLPGFARREQIAFDSAKGLAEQDGPSPAEERWLDEFRRRTGS